VTPELEAKLAGRRVVASISGGKDSAAMSLWLTEQEIEHDRVFCDTGWETQETYDHLAYLAEKLGPITWLRGERQMEALVEHKGMFPQRTRRFCTQELKVKPIIAYVHALLDGGACRGSCGGTGDIGGGPPEVQGFACQTCNGSGRRPPVDVINAVGIRAGESEARRNMAEWEWSKDFDCEVWRPLIGWSEEDVIEIHRRHDVRPNPLYLLGASRVGCFPCIFARKAEIRFIADHHPGQIVRIRQLEERVQAAAFKRQEARGEGGLYHPPTFFQAPIRDAEGKRLHTPIDEIVAWSRTSRGGRQVELFAGGAAEEGCMRWGLCDTGSAS
jgi:3'-phosphoadenosine 5'-phosphosulfate sulfotransferase (PAPS reductase)/FAD synthetase